MRGPWDCPGTSVGARSVDRVAGCRSRQGAIGDPQLTAGSALLRRIDPWADPPGRARGGEQHPADDRSILLSFCQRCVSTGDAGMEERISGSMAFGENRSRYVPDHGENPPRSGTYHGKSCSTESSTACVSGARSRPSFHAFCRFGDWGAARSTSQTALVACRMSEVNASTGRTCHGGAGKSET